MATLDLGTAEMDAVSLFGAAPVVAYSCAGSSAGVFAGGAELSFQALALSGLCAAVAAASPLPSLSGHWLVSARADAVSASLAALAGPCSLSGRSDAVSSSTGFFAGSVVSLSARAGGVFAAAGVVSLSLGLSAAACGTADATVSLGGTLTLIGGAAAMSLGAASGVLDVRPQFAGASTPVSASLASLRCVPLALAGSAAGVSGSGVRLALPFWGACAAVSSAVVPALYCPVPLEGFLGPDTARRPQLAGAAAGVSAASAWMAVSGAPNVFLEGA